MGFVNKWKGKNVKIDSTAPQGLGVCDDSGFDFNHVDLVKQMEWRGNSLVWTGLMVGMPYLDVPSEQNRPPIAKGDPKTLKNPRLPKDYNSPEENPVESYNQLLIKLNNAHWNE